MFHETYRKTHVSDSVFQQSSRLKVCYFIKIDIWHKSVPVNFSKILRTAFLQNTSKYSTFNNEKSVIKVRIIIRITGIRDTCNSIIITSFYQRRIRTQRDSHWRNVQWKKTVSKNFAKFTGRKLTLAHVFSCEFCQIFKNNLFIQHHWTSQTSSGLLDTVKRLWSCFFAKVYLTYWLLMYLLVCM